MKKFWVKLLCFLVPVKKYRKRLKNLLMDKLGGEAASALHPRAKGNVLVSYMKDSLLLKDNDIRLKYHTNRWENREIARIFYALGYNVDCIDFNAGFRPGRQYDIMFDIVGRFDEFEKFLKPGALKMLHLTGSYGCYNNSRERERLAYLERRRGIRLSPERVSCEDGDGRLEVADVCSLVGNDYTLNTFPKRFHSKIKLVNLTGSQLRRVKTPGEYYPREREFLWMGGAGPVHKGLDLLLEVFARHPEWTLNVMSKINKKSKFYQFYKKELTAFPNIHFHGLVMPSSEKFDQIVSRCFAYINPSCAEATSTATVTALSVGLFPIISYDNGFTLPEGCGMYLDKCSVEEIEEAIGRLWLKNPEEVRREIRKIHQMTLKNFSRENFCRNMQKYLAEQIKIHFDAKAKSAPRSENKQGKDNEKQ